MASQRFRDALLRAVPSPLSALRLVAPLINMVWPRRETGWQLHFPVSADAPRMRRRDRGGQWQYRELTDAEARKFDEIDAW